jgi:hypothetical protein
MTKAAYMYIAAMMWPKFYFVTVYFLWEYLMDIDTRPAAYLTVLLWLAFFLATRSYTWHLPTKMKRT